MKRGLALTFGLLKQAHHQKKVYCEVKKCKQTLMYLKALRENSIIYGYSVVPETNRVFVYLRYYRNRPSMKSIRLFSKPGFRRFIAKRTLFEVINKKTNPGCVLLVNSSKTSNIEQLTSSRFDKNVQFSNKNFGKLISCVL